jgi:hypothetical protein
MVKRIYRSSQGKSVDLGALLLQNETVRAVGNMGVNARGDRINNRNKIVDTKVQQVTRQYNKQIGPQDDIPQATADSAKVVSKTPVAPDPFELQKTNTEEIKSFKQTKNIKTTKAKSTKPSVEEQPKIEKPVETKTETSTAKPSGGLADAIARAKTIKQEALKTPRQQAQEKAGVKRI